MGGLTFAMLEAEEAERDLYQTFDHAEEIKRISFHYENDPEFFKIVTVDDWWTYSCPLWADRGHTITQAQEAKLDVYAQEMRLKPGQVVLDVGCGWGGPLVYLCKKYGVKGHGISVSPKGLEIAKARAEEHGVDADFELVHYHNLPDRPQYDAIYTDEVLVHMPDLKEFFTKANGMLKSGGRTVHKDLHFTHSKYKHAKDPLSSHVNKMYAFSGHYRTLADVLVALDASQFKLDQIIQIPVEDYKRTMDEVWIPSINANRGHLEKLTDPKHVRDFKMYLKAILHLFRQNIFNLHIVSAQKLD